MLFSSLVFLFFFMPFTLVGYYALRPWRSLQNYFLFFVSLFFYGWGEPEFVLVLLVSITCNWFFGLSLQRNAQSKVIRRVILLATLVLNLGIMYYFKYHTFTLTVLSQWVNVSHIPRIALPIGISFFTFQALSYVLDVFMGKVEAQKNPLDVGLYVALFPQLIAGPILRYETIAQQIHHRKETVADFSHGVVRFIVGLSKKVLLANQFALVSEEAVRLTQKNAISSSAAWVGAIAYGFQILFDFSGYSDMAIGLGKMFGFHFPENFDSPYISKSVSEFWRRWHISLGSWFREYVYFPLGGSRVTNQGRLYFNLLVVWALTGIWHGANWTFILWGLFYFVLISLEKAIGFEKLQHREDWIGRFFSAIGHGYTLIMVLIGWVVFRASTLLEASQYLQTMFHLGLLKGLQPDALRLLGENRIFFVIAFLACLPWLQWRRSGIRAYQGIKGVVLTLAIVAMFFISIVYLVKGSYNPFIYFNF